MAGLDDRIGGWLPGPLRGRRKETGETGTVLCLLSGGGKEPSSSFFAFFFHGMDDSRDLKPKYRFPFFTA